MSNFTPINYIEFAAQDLEGVKAFYSKAFAWEFYNAQAVATLITMAINFSLNNVLTYRDRRLQGLGFIKGLISFYIFCSIGALANFQFAEFLFKEGIHWLLAGFAGAVVGAVWNYAMTATFTWAKKKRRLK